MERAKGRRRAKQAIIVLGGTVLAIAGIGRLWPRERLLMNLAHPVANAGTDRTNYCWLSSDRLLIVDTADDSGDGSDTHWQGSVEVVNTTTHARKSLPALANMLKHTMESPMLEVDNLKASPDGMWLLWNSHAIRGPWELQYVARVDGTHEQEWEPDFDVETERGEDDFFLDSRHLIRLSFKQPMMVVLDLLDPSQDRTYRKLEQVQSVLAQDARLQPVISTVKVTWERSVEIDTYRTQDRLQLVQPKGDATPIRKCKPTLPDGAIVRDTILSPQQSIVYHLEVARIPWMWKWLHRLLPKLSAKPIVTEELWVSRADGTGLHEIGHIPVSAEEHADANGFLPDQVYELNDIQWLPNGKQISFDYNNCVYAVPLDMEK